MKIKIQLAKVKNLLNKNDNVLVPFWFSNDRTIHLSGSNTSTEFELKSLSLQTLIDINNGVVNGMLETEQFDAVKKQIASIQKAKVNEAAAPKKEVKEKPSEVKSLKEEISTFIAKASSEIKELMGSDDDESAGSPKYNRVDFLSGAIDAESGKKNPRKAIVALLKSRLKKINEIISDTNVLDED